MEKYYTIVEVARVLQLSEETIRRHIKAKRLKAVKLGQAYRITETDLQEFLKG